MNLEDLYRLLRNGHLEAQGIIDTVPDPLLLLDQNLRVRTASRAFFSTFKVGHDDTIDEYLYDLGDGQWDIPGFAPSPRRGDPEKCRCRGL